MQWQQYSISKKRREQKCLNLNVSESPELLEAYGLQKPESKACKSG
jgi:hypothetical protein